MVKYLRSFPFGGCVWGSGVRLDGGAPLPSFFEAFVNEINSLTDNVRFCCAQRLGRFFKFLYTVVVESYTEHRRFGILRWTPHFFLFADMIPLLS